MPGLDQSTYEPLFGVVFYGLNALATMRLGHLPG